VEIVCWISIKKAGGLSEPCPEANKTWISMEQKAPTAPILDHMAENKKPIPFENRPKFNPKFFNI
jgi:hypothetical protein